MKDTIGQYIVKEKLAETNQWIYFSGLKEGVEKKVLIKQSNLSNISDIHFSYYCDKKIKDKLKKEYNLPIIEIIESEKAIVYHKPAGQILSSLSGKLEIKKILELSLKLISSIDHLHQKDFIHKNIHLNNFWLNSETQKIQMIDLGFASDKKNDKQDSTLISKEIDLIPFISPEQTGRIDKILDKRSDFYSLGVCIYHLLYNRMPYDASSVVDWIYCHLTKKPIFEKQNDDFNQINKIVECLLDKDPNNRYQNSNEIKHDLRLCVDFIQQSPRIESFAIRTLKSATLDYSGKIISQDQHLNTLKNALNQSNLGKNIVIIYGEHGVGKSTLLSHYKSVNSEEFQFIDCSFSNKINSDHQFLEQVISKLVLMILCEPNKKKKVYKKEIIEKIYPHNDLFASLFPDIKKIIGGQDKLADKLDPGNHELTENLSSRFLSIFSKKESPLTIVLDNLTIQHAKYIKLIDRLIDQRGYLTVIFSFSTKNNAHHQKIEKIVEQIRCIAIKIEPFSENITSMFLANLLGQSKDDVKNLAAVVYDKTGGNILSIKNLIDSVVESDDIYWDYNKNRWIFNISNISLEDISEVLVESRLNQIEDKQDLLLKCASCIGKEFDLETLIKIFGESDQNLVQHLKNLSKGIIISLSTDSNNHLNRFKFLHKKLQLAYYDMLNSQEKMEMHLKIARTIGDFDFEDMTKDLGKIVYHYNQALPLIDCPKEKDKLIKLNLRISSLELGSGSYIHAQKACEYAKIALPDDSWISNSDLSFKVYFQLAKCCYYIGDYSQEEKYLDEILSHTKDPLEVAEVYNLMITQKIASGKLAEALELGVQGLNRAGINLSVDYSEDDVLKEEELIKSTLGGRSIHELINLPKIKGRKEKITVSLMINIIVPAITLGKMRIFNIILAKIIRYFMKHGIVPECTFVFITYASQLVNSGKVSEECHQWAKLGLALEGRLGHSNLRCRAYWVYSVFVLQWFEHRKRIKDFLIEAVESGFHSGDLYFLAYACYDIIQWIPDQSIEEAVEEGEKYIQIIRDSNFNNVLDLALLSQQLRKNLLCLTWSRHSLSDKNFDEQECLERMVSRKYLSGVCWYYLIKLKIALFNEDYECLSELADKVEENFVFAGASPSVIEIEWLSFIGKSQIHNKKSASRDVLEKLEKKFEKMEKWSYINHINFEHYKIFMAAELERLSGKAFIAIDKYLRASTVCFENGFLHDYALFNDLISRFFAEEKNEDLSCIFLLNAYITYQKLGNKNRLQKIEELHKNRMLNCRFSEIISGFLSSKINVLSSQSNLEFESMSKTTQAIAGETKIEYLLPKLMDITQKYAGAEKILLLLKEDFHTIDSPFYIESSCADNGEFTVERGQKLEDSQELPVKLVHLTISESKVLSLGYASKEGGYTNDPYIKRRNSKSILILPLVNKGEVSGILYLENSGISYAFTDQSIETIRFIASLAAISIENARLYSEMEKAVHDRTVKLRNKTRDINMILRSIKQGICTINQDFEIYPEYSKHLEEILNLDNLSTMNILNLLYSEVEISDNNRSTIESAVYSIIGETKIGFDLNSHLLPEEININNKQILELDWEPIVDENDIVDKIMLTVRDVTRYRALQLEAKKQKVDNEMTQQILDMGINKFKKFLDNLLKEVEVCYEIARKNMSIESLDELCRYLHTIKGNSRTFKLINIVEIFHEAEQYIVNLKNNPKDNMDSFHFLEKLNQCKEVMYRYEKLFTSRFASLVMNEIDSEALNFYKAFDEYTGKLTKGSTDAERLEVFSKLLLLKDYEPLSSMLEESVKSLDDIAIELGKPTPEVIIKDQGILFQRKQRTFFQSIMNHCFKNAIDHGIEPEDERIKNGKQVKGVIKILVTEDNHGRIYIRFSDDGRGIGISKLRDIALQDGKRSKKYSDHELADQIFHPGVSSSKTVSHISGRGVGLDAVKKCLQEKNGDIKICFTNNKVSEGYQSFEFELLVPPSYAVLGNRRSRFDLSSKTG